MPSYSAIGRTAAVKRSTASSDSQTSMIWKPSSVSTNGRRRYSLFTGDVGTALCAAACLGVDALPDSGHALERPPASGGAAGPSVGSSDDPAASSEET